MTGETVLDGRYRLVRRIGQGGFGSIFLAEQVALARPVVIKSVRTDMADVPDLVERFRREAVLVAGIRHPNVVTYHDFGQDAEGDLLLVMELLEGESLTEHLARHGPMPADRAAGLLRQAAAGLAAAHRAGLVHRDVKPSNLFLEQGAWPAMRLKVIDFGILKADARIHPDLAVLTRSDICMGTPDYVAPEQLLGVPVGPAADQYALGLVAFEMVTGTKLFSLRERPDDLIARLAGPCERLGALARTHAGPAFTAAVTRAVSTQPGDRFASIEEFASALTPADATEARALSTPAVSTRIRRRASRRWWVALGLAVLGMLAIGAGWWIGWPGPSAEPTAATGTSSSIPPSVPVPRGAEGAAWMSPQAAPLPEELVTRSPVQASRVGARTSRMSMGTPPASVRPSQTPTGFGRLTINALPWAEVSVDDQVAGTTPLILQEVASGQHRVTLRHPEYETRTFTVQVVSGETTHRSVRMASDPGVVP